MLSQVHTSVQQLPVVWQRRMSRFLPFIVALSVIVMGLWHIYAAHHASFVSGLFEAELGVVKSNLKYKQVELGSRVHRTQNTLKHTLNVVSGLEHKVKATDDQILKLEQEKEELRIWIGQIVRHISGSTHWRALKDYSKFSIRGFMSEIISRNNERGPPELFEFPSALSDGRHLCFRGNDTSNGSRNFYTFAWEEALPSGYILLNGTTLISSQPDAMAIGDQPICFQKAVVSRLGLGGVPTVISRELYARVRCQVRTFCKLPTTRTTTVNGKQSINIALMVRSGGREWKDQKAWEKVIDDQCAKVEGCRWTSMYFANMTFCEQVGKTK